MWWRRLGLFAVVACVVVTTWALATRRRAADTGPAGERVGRMYDVGDLLDAPVFEPEVSEPNGQTPSSSPSSPSSPLFGPASGLGTGPGVGSGRGSLPTPEQQRLAQLEDLLREGVDPRSWGT